MSQLNRSWFSGLLFTAVGLSALPLVAADVPRGVETIVQSVIQGEERTRQPKIWAMEVRFKSLRMILVDVTDRKTGKKRQELVWYLPYRVINRGVDGVNPPAEVDGSRPSFVPEFTLVTTDNNQQKIYHDEVLLEAQAAINRREKQNYKNVVEMTAGPIPELTPKGSKLDRSIHGVAMWRGVDPETDFFKIFMTGFSNGYQRLETPDGKLNILRRTIVQEYARPGDRVQQSEREIKPAGTPRWIYR